MTGMVASYLFMEHCS